MPKLFRKPIIYTRPKYSQTATDRPSSPMFTSCFALPARYLLHRASAKEPEKQLASATHVHTSVNGSGSPQQFGIGSHSLWHGNWSGRSGYDLFCQRTTQNATHKYFAWLSALFHFGIDNRQSRRLELLHFCVLYVDLRPIKGSHELKRIRPIGLPHVRQRGLVTFCVHVSRLLIAQKYAAAVPKHCPLK